MRMTKKVVSIVLAVMMVAAMMSVMAISASATEAGTPISTSEELYNACRDGGEYYLTQNIDMLHYYYLVRNDVTIHGNDYKITAYKNESVHSYDVFVWYDNSHASLTIDNVTLDGANAAECAVNTMCSTNKSVCPNNNDNADCKVTMTGCTVQNFAGFSYVGAVYIFAYAEGEFNNCTFTNNITQDPTSAYQGSDIWGGGGTKLTINGGSYSGTVYGNASGSVASTVTVENATVNQVTLGATSQAGADVTFVNSNVATVSVEDKNKSDVNVDKDTELTSVKDFEANDASDAVNENVITTAAELVAAATTGGEWILGADINLTTGLEISGESANYGVYVTKDFVLDGANHTINSTVARAIGVKGDGEEIDVTFKNVTINDSQTGAICICTRGNIGSLTLDNVKLDTEGTKQPYNQPLTIGGTQSTKATVTIKNGSVIQTNSEGSQYYAIILWNPVDMTIQDSTIKGWACVYAKPDATGTDVTIDNCTLVSKGLSGYTNDFGAIVTETDDFDCTITNSTIDVTAAANTYQAIAVPSFNDKVNIELGEGNDVTMTGDTAVVAFNDSDGDVEVTGGTFNKDIDTFAADGYVGVQNANGTYGVEVDTNPLNGKIEIEGYQNKVEGSDSTSDDGNDINTKGLRILTKVDNEFLADADDYGYVVAKVSGKAQASAKFDLLTADKSGGNGQKVISCKGTVNNGIDGVDNTYVTLAVNGMNAGDQVAARFYVVKDGTYYSYYVGAARYNGIIATMS